MTKDEILLEACMEGDKALMRRPKWVKGEYFYFYTSVLFF